MTTAFSTSLNLYQIQTLSPNNLLISPRISQPLVEKLKIYIKGRLWRGPVGKQGCFVYKYILMIPNRKNMNPDGRNIQRIK